MSITLHDFKAEFGDWLKRNRQFAGISAEALAAKIGVTGSAISAWERGISTPTLHNAILLSWALGANLPIPAPLTDEFGPDRWGGSS